ncbi:MAG TPA: hypothetical protein VMH80_20990 [Bryobacteraceae bacterium]|nr:hypothetical protein [Bryobacteraceae bacterium]
MIRFLGVLFLLLPAVVYADSQFTLVSPTDGATVVVTPNQVLPVIMDVADTDTGLSAFYARQYVTSVTATPTCPPEANPCGNYVVQDGPVPPFTLRLGYEGAIAIIKFENAPLGFYTFNLSISINGCYTVAPNCPLPDSYQSSTKFTVQVVGRVGAQPNVLPEFAEGGGRFLTDILVVNNGSQPANFTISFFDDSGTPAALLFAGLGTLTTLTDTVPAFGTNTYEAGDISAPTRGGWGLIQADPSLTIQEVIRSHGSDGSYYEAAVPAYSGSTGFRLSFDATTFTPTGDPIYTGFAVANLDTKNSATVTCTARDFRGQVIPDAITIPMLNPSGHWADYLFPALTGARGTLDCTSTTQVAAIGLRFIGSNAFTSLPVVTK